MEILNKPSAEISTINRGTGTKENGIMIFEVIVLGILEYFGIEWSAMQIRETAEMMYSEYYWLQIAELKHFALRAKSGMCGDFPGRAFLPVNLMGWFRNYANESLWIREQRYIAESMDDRYDERWTSKDKRDASAEDASYMQEKIKQMQREATQKQQNDNQ